MPYQQIFNTAVLNLVQQGEKSSKELEDKESICFFRFEEENKVLRCAVGYVLTDAQIEKYGIKEGTNPYQFPQALIQELMPGVDIYEAQRFLAQLQNAHDSSNSDNFVKSFTYSAKKIAKEYDLEIPDGI